MAPVEIYGNADVAALLAVTPAAVGNWLARHNDTPEPFATTSDGRRFWDRNGMAWWLEWHREQQPQRSTRMDALRAELTQR